MPDDEISLDQAAVRPIRNRFGDSFDFPVWFTTNSVIEDLTNNTFQLLVKDSNGATVINCNGANATVINNIVYFKQTKVAMDLIARGKYHYEMYRTYANGATKQRLVGDFIIF